MDEEFLKGKEFLIHINQKLSIENELKEMQNIKERIEHIHININHNINEIKKELECMNIKDFKDMERRYKKIKKCEKYIYENNKQKKILKMYLFSKSYLLDLMHEHGYIKGFDIYMNDITVKAVLFNYHKI